MRPPFGLALGVVWALAGCHHKPRPTYVPLDLPLPAAPEDSSEAVRKNVAWAMERGRLPRLRWSPSTGLPERELAIDELEQVPTELLWTAWVVSPKRMRGSELDLLVAADTGAVPLTVEVDLDGGVTLRRGDALPATGSEMPDREASMRDLARRHGLGAFVDGERTWTADELHMADQALGLLDHRERSLLAGLVLSRDVISPRHARELALYDPKVDPVVIHVYDGAFAASAWSFVGPLEQPWPAPVMTLVHEFGHVISDAPLTAAWKRFLAASSRHYEAAPEDRPLTGAQLRLARRELRHHGHRGPVIDGFARLRPGRLWPTSWSTDIFESFAEAFALYKTDPDALLRVAPQAHAWFHAGEHLAWRDFPG